MLKIGELFFKFRDYTPIPFIIAMFYWAAPTSSSILIGTIIAVIGELIRIYGVAYIGGVSRTRTFSTGQKLITSGPYAHVRNTLYIGNLLLSSGLVVISNVNIDNIPNSNAYFLAFFVAFFFIQYIPVVLWEESNLQNIFKEEFTKYKSQVPRWIPSLSNKTNNTDKIAGDYPMALKSEKSTLTTTVIVFLGLLFRANIIALLDRKSVV